MSAGVRPVAIITGAAGGIGLATTGRFVDAGFDVLAADLDGAPFGDLPSVVERRSGVHAVVADVTSVDGWQRVMAECRERFGRLDVLFDRPR